MAIIKAISSKASIGRICNYVLDEKKTPSRLCSGLNLDPLYARDEMELTKKIFHKTGGRTYKHFVQSFHQNEPITAQEAHKIATETVLKSHLFDEFEVLFVTHENEKHLHTHIVVNSVSFIDGHKLNQSPADLRLFKEVSDNVCKEHGLTITEKGKTFEKSVREETTANKSSTYHQLKKAEVGQADSYVQRIALAVMDAAEVSCSKEEFIANLADNRIDTIWRDNRKYITFVDLDRQKAGETKYKVRNKRLTQYYNFDFSKEELEHGFETNTRTAEELALRLQQAEYDRKRDTIERRKSETERRNQEIKRKNRDAQQERLAAARSAENAARKREEEERARLERKRIERERERNRGYDIEI